MHVKHICISLPYRKKERDMKRATILNTQKLATQKGIGFSVSKYGRKAGYEYWTNESIKETGESIQFKGNLKDFYLFLQNYA